MWQESIALIKEIIKESTKDNIDLYSPSISFYLILSLAPTLMVIVSLGGFFVGDQVSSSWIAFIASSYFGPEAVSFIRNIYIALNNLGTNILALFISIIFILYGISGVFSRLRGAFIDIFNFEGEEGIKGAVKTRIISIVYVFVLFLLLFIAIIGGILGNLVISTGQSLVGAPELVWNVANYLITLVLTALIFMLIYKSASRRILTWSATWKGAIVGSVMFSLINALFGIYVSYSSSISAYGAASFLVVFILWMNYFIYTLFIGAEVSKVIHCRHKEDNNICG